MNDLENDPQLNNQNLSLIKIDLNLDFPKKNKPQWISSQYLSDLTNSSIQNLINDAQPYSEIIIPEGEYHEGLVLIKPIKLRADGNVIIKGIGISHTITCSSEFIEIEGINFQNVESDKSVIVVFNGYTLLKNCRIETLSKSCIQAVGESLIECQDCDIEYSSQALLIIARKSFGSFTKCIFRNSKANGIYVVNDGRLMINECLISKNNGIGICVLENSNVVIKNSKIKRNSKSGIEIFSNKNHLIEQCLIKGHNNYGLLSENENNIIVRNCKFEENGLACLIAQKQSRIMSFDNSFSKSPENTLVISCENGVIQLVNDQFSGACMSAITSFNNGKIIGENLEIAEIGGSGIVAFNEGIVIIDGAKINNPSNPAIEASQKATLKLNNIQIKNPIQNGINIQSGVKGYLKHVSVVDGKAGGMFVSDVSELLVKNCEFYNNQCFGVALQNTEIIIKSCKLVDNRIIGLDIIRGGSLQVITKCLISGSEQAGIQVHERGQSNISNCIIKDCYKVGISVINASPIIKGSKITNCETIGISCFQGAKPVFDGCEICHNKNSGAQIYQQETYPIIKNCNFYGNQKGVSILLIDNAKVNIENSTFSSCGIQHLQIRDNAIASCSKCDFSFSNTGISIQVSSGGKVLMNDESIVHDEDKYGILVGDEGKAEINNSTVKNCGISGVLILEGGKASLFQGKIQNNGKYGIQIMGGEADIIQSIISDHSNFGIAMTKLSRIVDSENKFINNAKNDIFVQ
jgi:hypothetical protein